MDVRKTSSFTMSTVAELQYYFNDVYASGLNNFPENMRDLVKRYLTDVFQL